MTLHNSQEEYAVKELLDCLQTNSSITLKALESIGRLSEKRVTLEEKMIRGYLHSVMRELAQMDACLHETMRLIYQPEQSKIDSSLSASQRGDKACTALITLKDAVAPARTLQKALSERLDELNKVLAFNLNFTEQYFEHEFYARLHNEDHFPVRIKELTDTLRRLDQLA